MAQLSFISEQMTWQTSPKVLSLTWLFCLHLKIMFWEKSTGIGKKRVELTET